MHTTVSFSQREKGGSKKIGIPRCSLNPLQIRLDIPNHTNDWTICTNFTFNGFTGSLEAKSHVLPKACSSLPWCLSLRGFLGAEGHHAQKKELGLRCDGQKHTQSRKKTAGNVLCIPEENLRLLQKRSLGLQNIGNPVNKVRKVHNNVLRSSFQSPHGTEGSWEKLRTQNYKYNGNSPNYDS